MTLFEGDITCSVECIATGEAPIIDIDLIVWASCWKSIESKI